MKKLLLSDLVFAAISSSGLAAEPLTEQQMDTITAGQTYLYFWNGSFAAANTGRAGATWRYLGDPDRGFFPGNPVRPR